jgi:hypothetical protein
VEDDEGLGRAAADGSQMDQSAESLRIAEGHFPEIEHKAAMCRMGGPLHELSRGSQIKLTVHTKADTVATAADHHRTGGPSFANTANTAAAARPRTITGNTANASPSEGRAPRWWAP